MVVTFELTETLKPLIIDKYQLLANCKTVITPVDHTLAKKFFSSSSFSEIGTLVTTGSIQSVILKHPISQISQHNEN